MHFSVADAGFDSMHVEQVQDAPLGADGAFIPAAVQSNPFAGMAVGLGASSSEAGVVIGEEFFRACEMKSKCGSADIGIDATSLRVLT